MLFASAIWRMRPGCSPLAGAADQRGWPLDFRGTRKLIDDSYGRTTNWLRDRCDDPLSRMSPRAEARL
jgi:hypothetical protein